MRRSMMVTTVLSIGAAVTALGAAPVVAHPHTVQTPSHTQQLANGQNHPGFVAGADGIYLSCDGVNELSGTGPAFYGLETAHHGPDAGTPGKGDRCYGSDGPPSRTDRNPAIG